jgi:coproporphyrinogen III oxidase-like Fe-S oxidoreductase
MRKNISKEILNSDDIFLEKVMFGLRTWGLWKDIAKNLDRERIKNFIKDWFLYFDSSKEYLKITNKWVVFLDYIIKEIL